MAVKPSCFLKDRKFQRIERVWHIQQLSIPQINYEYISAIFQLCLLHIPWKISV